MAATTTKAKTQMLRQVLLRSGTKQDVFWIRNEIAKAGKRVVDDKGTVWIVVETYNARPFEDVDRQIRTWAEFAETLDKAKR